MPHIDNKDAVYDMLVYIMSHVLSWRVFGFWYGNIRRKYSDVALTRYHKNAATSNGINIDRPIQSNSIIAPNASKLFIVASFVWGLIYVCNCHNICNHCNVDDYGNGCIVATNCFFKAFGANLDNPNRK